MKKFKRAEIRREWESFSLVMILTVIITWSVASATHGYRAVSRDALFCCYRCAKRGSRDFCDPVLPFALEAELFCARTDEMHISR